MKLPCKNTELVWIEWQDAFASKDHLDLNALSTIRLVTNHSIGWIVDEDSERLILAHCVSTSGEYDFEVIPVGWIKQRIAIVKSNKKHKGAQRVPVHQRANGQRRPGPNDPAVGVPPAGELPGATKPAP